MAEEAHHNVMAQRKRLGMAPIQAKGSKDYSGLNGFSAYFLGVFYGLQYN
jgi:hypothetical protein